MLSLPGYEITEQIHESHNSLVYRGYRLHDRLGIVIKMCKQIYPDPVRIYRYQQEFEILNTLKIPGVVQVYDVVLTDDRPYLVLEDFGGISLSKLNIAGTFDLVDFLRIAISVTEIVGNIHERKIIHKDLNPSNILLNVETQEIKIIDFGIATVLEQETQTFVNANLLEGTLAYISPEQTGRMNRQVDYRSDFYALGITFYELLTGTLPFKTENVLELIHHHIARTPIPSYLAQSNANKDPQQRQDLQSISRIIDKLLEKNAENRYQSAYGLGWDLKFCYQTLKQGKHLPSSFPLAQQDFSPNLHISQQLYGRESDLQQILAAFDSVISGEVETEPITKLVLISGYSGVGKSVLVRELYKPITALQGILISGKYDQYNQNIPYSALNHALNELCTYLLTESEDVLAHWRDLIQSALGEHGQVLIDFIPKLELIIGPQKDIPALSAIESQRRFNLFFQNFMEVICTPEHPVVIFLDDLQWADLASLHLLEAIVNNQNIQSCLLIGTYRDNEVDSLHPLSKTIAQIREHQSLVELHLNGLSRDEVNQLIADSLSLDLTVCKPLGDLVFLKTGGNPFFTIEFLKSLQRKGLLFFHLPSSSEIEKGTWQWDIEAIDDARFMANIVDLMVEKINNLDPVSKSILRVSACIGSTFNLEKLSLFYSNKFPDVYRYFSILLDLNLIIPLTKNYQLRPQSISGITDPEYFLQAQQIQFQFAHDRVQQVAYSLLEQREEQTIHLRLGKLLYNRYKNTDIDSELFDIVSHLNQGMALLKRSSGFLKTLANLNLRAGRKAKCSTAISAALDYFQMSLRCLPDDHWQQNPEFSLELYQELAEVQYLNGDHHQSRQTIDILFERAQSLQQKVTTFSLFKNLLVTVGQDYREVLQVGLDLMQQCHLNFPSQPQQQEEAILAQLEAIRLKRSQYQAVSDLITLPVLEDPLQQVKMKLCMEFYEAAFYNGETSLILLTALNLVALSLTYGNSKESSFGYVLYGMYLVEEEDFQQGYDFGNLALQVLEKFDDSVMLPKVRNLFCNYINYYLKPFSSNAIFYHENIAISQANGEIIFGVWATIFYLWSLFLSGKKLNEVYQASEHYWQFTQQTNDLKMMKVLQLLQLVILSLQGQTEARGSLQTSSLEAQELVTFWQDHNFINGLTWYAILHCQVLYTYGAYREAIEVIQTYAQELSPNIIMFPVSQYYVYYPLALIAAYPSASSQEQQDFLEVIEEALQKLALWQNYCPENFRCHYLLLQAEIAQLQGEKTIAMDLYDQAIATAQVYQILPQQALANELTGLFWLKLNKVEFAGIHLSKAYYQYQLWGATGKVQALAEKYGSLLTELSTPRSERSVKSIQDSSSSESISTRNVGLDLESVLQVSHTLASEMNLENLLEKIMRVVIENSGAEVAYLLVEDQQRWRIKASGKIHNQAVVVDCPVSLDENDRDILQLTAEQLPRTVLNYVSRTRKPFVLDQETLNYHFLNDPYLRNNQPQSVLCLPLTHQSQLLGLLYLENNTLKGIFTDDRLKTLQIITTQAAISLENAQLYNQLTSYSKTLETKVKLRTEELELAKDAADRANQSKSEFLSNMSHELRTPLNAILGFTQIMMRDSNLSPDQQENLDIISRSGEHLLALINDILDLSKIDAGRITLQSGNFDLHSLLNTLEKMLGVKASHKNLELIFDLSPNLPQYVCADANKLRQILINLISNSIKFTHHGGVTLRAFYVTQLDLKCDSVSYWDATHDDTAGQNSNSTQSLIKFEVEDTGIGIAPEDLENIFEPFVQTQATQNFVEGTGLGLAITRKFIDLMGGDIKISSHLNQGTTVTFHLPITLAQAEETPVTTPPKRVLKVDSDQNYRILIAEDRIESRHLLVKLLKPLGFEVKEVPDGQSAIELWESWSPHLILMDMRMPVMSGYDATQYIKQHLKGQATIIIALTASAFSDDRSVILSAGCDDFLGKPFREAVLLEKISQHLGIRYIYEEMTPALSASPASASALLSPTDLHNMPSDWIQALYQAASQADSDALLELIQEIPLDNRDLANALRRMVENFSFDQMINLTQVEG
ncbi:MAG: protein kinase domain-containing protein [Prochlorotrichaceae cyanobacterium]